MNNGAMGTQLQISGTPVGTAGVVEVLTTETTIFAASSKPRQVTVDFSNITAGSLNLTVYLKPTLATAAADANTLVKTWAVAADTIFTKICRIPAFYVLTALASATGINADGFGTEEI